MRRTQLLDESQSSLDSTVSAGLSRRVSRASTARVNYIFRDGGYRTSHSDTTPIRLHDVELGYDLDMAHSPTRRTTIAFSGGPSFVEYQGRRSTRAFGGVALAHPFSRSWSLRAFYRRGVTFLDGSDRPFLSDSVSIGLAGLVTRRLDVSVTAGAVLGDIGLEAGVAGAATPYDTYTGSSRVRFGLTNSTALFAEYLATYSRYNSGVPAAARSQSRRASLRTEPLRSDRARLPPGTGQSRRGSHDRVRVREPGSHHGYSLHAARHVAVLAAGRRRNRPHLRRSRWCSPAATAGVGAHRGSSAEGAHHRAAVPDVPVLRRAVRLSGAPRSARADRSAAPGARLGVAHSRRRVFLVPVAHHRSRRVRDRHRCWCISGAVGWRLAFEWVSRSRRTARAPAARRASVPPR